MKTKVLLVSILTILLCISVIAGSTYALFTTQTDVNIAVGAAKLAVTADIDEGTLATKSFGEPVFSEDGTFSNGGTAGFNDETGALEVDAITPGDALTFDIIVENTGDVDVAYTVEWSTAFDPQNNPDHAGKTDMFSALKFDVRTKGENGAVGEEFFDANGAVYHALGDRNNPTTTFVVIVEFENGANNDDFQNAIASINFTVKTVQYNGIDADGKIIT